MTNKNIITYGCRLNIYESEVIQKHMDEAGLKIVFYLTVAL